MKPNRHLITSLKTHCEALALQNGRRVGQPGHEIAKAFLLAQMKRLSLLPFRENSLELSYERLHPKTRKNQSFTNLVGVLPGKNREKPPILIGAHYDSVIDAPCVDDNATSVAVTLELAKHFKQQSNLERDLVFAFFDAEEPPHFLGETMGSRRFCEDHCQNMKFAAVLVSDLIGHEATDNDLPIPSFAKSLFPHLKKLIAVMGAESDPAFPEILETAAGKEQGLRVISTLHRYVGPMSDHGPFADAGHPFLFLSCGQGRHYHTPEDQIGWINFRKLAHTARFMADLVTRIDNSTSLTGNGHCDPFEMEARMLRKALGPMVTAALLRFGVKIPNTRKELDHFVTSLVDGTVR